ncbi:ABC transporter permease [Brevibacterium album]|uniref:ABC transporter permease n=1 Tax=Brevibacterium album TaxID=417948 RepID=UPI0004266946|nr:ABC transporter permease [Brevibacterium album]
MNPTARTGAPTAAEPMSSATPPRRRARILLGYAGWDLLRTVRMFSATFFIVVLPMAMFLIFGGIADYGDQALGRGNGSAYVMTSMAVYGAVTAMTATAGSAAVERQQGWGRQLGLTALSNGMYAAGKCLVGLAMALLPVLALFFLATAMGARFDHAWMWPITGLIVLIGSLPFALYGLASALLFRSEAAVSVASGLLVLLAFFGNLFMPLSGAMLAIAKFTPLYGLASAARWPQLEGQLLQIGPAAPEAGDSLLFSVLNVVVWTAVFGAICGLAGRRRTAR